MDEMAQLSNAKTCDSIKNIYLRIKNQKGLKMCVCFKLF